MKYIFSVVFLCLAFLLHAQTEQAHHDYRLGVQLGVDVGGVLPTPITEIPKLFRAYPQVMATVGGRGEMCLFDMFYLGAELSYKHVEMQADAVVENMRAVLPSQGMEGADLTQYYTGQAEMNMEFDLLEIPLYFSYAFPKSEHNRFLFGFYGAWIMRGRFENRPIQGFVGTNPDQVDLIINSGDKVPAEQRNFSRYMSHWDWGLVAGYEREIFQRFYLGLHINWGLHDIFEQPILSYRMTQIRGTVLLSYALWQNDFTNKK